MTAAEDNADGSGSDRDKKRADKEIRGDREDHASLAHAAQIQDSDDDQNADAERNRVRQQGRERPRPRRRLPRKCPRRP